MLLGDDISQDPENFDAGGMLVLVSEIEGCALSACAFRHAVQISYLRPLCCDATR